MSELLSPLPSTSCIGQILTRQEGRVPQFECRRTPFLFNLSFLQERVILGRGNSPHFPEKSSENRAHPHRLLPAPRKPFAAHSLRPLRTSASGKSTGGKAPAPKGERDRTVRSSEENPEVRSRRPIRSLQRDCGSAPASSVSVSGFSEDRTHVAVPGHSHPDETPKLSGPRRDLLDGISDREHAGDVPPVVAESPGTGIELSVDPPAPLLQFGHCPDFTIKHSTHHPNIYETYRT